MNYDFLRKETVLIVKEIGCALRIERESFNASHVETKGHNDFVTLFDKQTEKRLVEKLSALLPSAGFIVEEQTSQKRSDVLNWIIDPIDGTTNFIHGLPIFALSVALVHENRLVVGVVYEVGADECFSAFEGGGAFLNGQPIAVSQTHLVADSLIATGFPYNNYSKMEPFMESLQFFMEHSHGLRRLGSAATDLAYVACGRFDAFYEYDLKPWDVAAGALLVKEAGGFVCDFSGGDDFIFGAEIIATNAGIKSEFVGRVSSFMIRK